MITTATPIPNAPLADDNPLRIAVRAAYHADETACVKRLLAELSAEVDDEQRRRIDAMARQLVTAVRADPHGHGGLDAFLQEYSLSSEEGVALMCLAEALLRVPDAPTADALIEDTLAGADWKSHLGQSESFFVNVSTWGLILTGRVISLDKKTVLNIGEFLARLVARGGEPLVRAALARAMRILGRQFVLAENIDAALKAARTQESRGYGYSYDMLGEAARTAADADRYFTGYAEAIEAIGKHDTFADPHRSAGVSVKLSALHPRYEFAQAERVLAELLPRIRALCQMARAHSLGLTIDAEESERLDPSLSVFERLALDASLQDWDGLGLAVQGYQKRAPAVIDWLQELAGRSKRKFMIRLVKGAYWDSEIKQAQVAGLDGYPVFTRKAATDVSYLACARKLLAGPDHFYPLFATHNAHTVASILAFAGERRDFEFQCLQGMGEALYDQVISQHRRNCRIYAPVGPHEALLPYLVRRLLENGANSSFVNRLVDAKLPIEQIIRDPATTLAQTRPKPHPNIPLPAHLYPDRRNSDGMNLFDSPTLASYYRAARALRDTAWVAEPKTVPRRRSSRGQLKRETAAVLNPATGEKIGVVHHACEDDIEDSVVAANAAAGEWDRLGGAARADILEAAAELYQQHRHELMFLCNVEAGKTLPDAVAEVREAVDFLRYYATLARRDFAGAQSLRGPTGESNQFSLHGRGVFACISPWNFPLAIFTGQTSAALAAGNCVIAKPAEQTPLIAARATELLHQAGVPESVLHYLPGTGAEVGARLAADTRIHGIAFTGSCRTARRIQCILANSEGEGEGAIRPLIAETGGINAMIVDSTALPEQVVGDVIASAFHSAGQRCSALRVLYLQDDVADGIVEMLRGAMAELRVGDPMAISTDLGPIIDQAARDELLAHIERCRRRGFPVEIGPAARAPASDGGTFCSPAIIEIGGIADLDEEVFGPILHIARFAAAELDRVVDAINAAGYGLTFGIHSRIQSTVARVCGRIRAGNVYVNRSMIGAVPGVQPFGGEGRSGTGSKAGGPNYLRGFALERAVSTDTTAAGGNASLLTLESS